MGAPRGEQAGGRQDGRRRHLRTQIATAAIVLGALLLPQSATAAFHEILVREVYAGASNSSYVVLQAYNPGQNAVGGHTVAAYGPNAGAQLGTFTFPGSVSNGADQMTILVGDSGYAAAFPSGPTADGTFADMNLDPAGGAVCWTGTPDCVSWGNFSGTTTPTVSPPAVAMSGGQALRRSIAAGCSTELEPGDRTFSSNADFSLQTPNPRNNASAIVETPCVAPNTSITSATIPNGGRTSSQANSFMFSSTAGGATFECKREPPAASFAACTSPQDYSGLDGDNAVTGTAHTFQVRAKVGTEVDPTPATHSWTVDTVDPTANITNQPSNPSPGGSAAFSFSANETSTFKCTLEGPEPYAEAACSSGKTYTTLPDGSYTFKVNATDQVGNVGADDTYEWTVDNSLADTTPPETTLLNKPPNPSTNADASFTYSSNEPGSTFKCKLDGAAFEDCPGAGESYTGLPNGPHTFQVYAIDSFGNEDKSPAGHSWEVAASIAPPPPLPPPPPPPPVPDTTITAKPGAVTKDRTPTFRFRSSVAGAGYSCKVDKAAFKFCSSPFTTKTLTFGRHSVQVRAVAGGAVDPTPAKSNFKVLKPKKKKK